MFHAEKLFLSRFMVCGHVLQNKQTKNLWKAENSCMEELTVVDNRIRAFLSVPGGMK